MNENDVDFFCFPEGFLTGYYADEICVGRDPKEVEVDLFQEWLKILNR